MSNRSYDKLKIENLELKEKLRAYENGNASVHLIEHIIRVPKSFQQFFSDWKNGIKKWEESEKNVHKLTFEDGEFNLVNAFSDLENSIPDVQVILVSGQVRQHTAFSLMDWELLLKLGNGDPSKGLDVLTKRYGGPSSY